MIQTRYITLDEFNEYFRPVDLRQELGSVDDALAFLVRREDEIEDFCNSYFNRNIEKEYPTFTDFQKIHYKRALLHQAYYIWHSGEIGADSGYSSEKGQTIKQSELEKIMICPKTKQNLIECGIWNRNIHSARTRAWGLFLPR